MITSVVFKKIRKTTDIVKKTRIWNVISSRMLHYLIHSSPTWDVVGLWQGGGGGEGEGETQSRVSHGVPSIILPASLLPLPTPPIPTPEMTGGRPHFLPAHSAGTCEAVGGRTPHSTSPHLPASTCVISRHLPVT